MSSLSGLTYASLFSGGGLADVGARNAGLTPIWGVEFDPAISAVAERNGLPRLCADVLSVDPRNFAAPTVLHASPPCPNFSVAKTGGAETDHDIAMGAKVAEFITALRPQVFTLENVYAYRDSQSFRRITDSLTEAGYFWDYDHINAADYGVPQTRQRLILRALRGALLPHLPEPEPWIGWYAAIEDLIPTLPASQFAPWQLARLPEELAGDLLVMTANNNLQDAHAGGGVPHAASPAMTVLSDISLTRARAFIVDGKPKNYQGDLQICDGDSRAVTVTASQARHPFRAFLMSKTADKFGDGVRQSSEQAQTIGANEHGSKAWLVDSAGYPGIDGVTVPVCREQSEPANTIVANLERRPMRAWLSAGRVVSMTPRALARFQSVPDSYTLPAKNSLATKIIGNGVACLMYQKLVSHLLIAVTA